MLRPSRSLGVSAVSRRFVLTCWEHKGGWGLLGRRLEPHSCLARRSVSSVRPRQRPPVHSKSCCREWRRFDIIRHIGFVRALSSGCRLLYLFARLFFASAAGAALLAAKVVVVVVAVVAGSEVAGATNKEVDVIVEVIAGLVVYKTTDEEVVVIVAMAAGSVAPGATDEEFVVIVAMAAVSVAPGTTHDETVVIL